MRPCRIKDHMKQSCFNLELIISVVQCYISLKHEFPMWQTNRTTVHKALAFYLADTVLDNSCIVVINLSLFLLSGLKCSMKETHKRSTC